MVARLTLDQLVGVRIPVPQFFNPFGGSLCHSERNVVE